MMELLSILYIPTRMPTWFNFKNKHDEGIMQIFCSHENSICVQVCWDALFVQSSLKKSLISLSNDVHLKEKSLETVGKKLYIIMEKCHQ